MSSGVAGTGLSMCVFVFYIMYVRALANTCTFVYVFVTSDLVTNGTLSRTGFVVHVNLVTLGSRLASIVSTRRHDYTYALVIRSPNRCANTSTKKILFTTRLALPD